MSGKSTHQTGMPAPFLACASLTALCIAAPVTLWSLDGRTHDPAALAMLTVILALSGARFSWVLYSRARRLHEMIIWLFVYLFLGVAPFLQILIRFPGTTPNMTDRYAVEAGLVVIAGSLAIMAGSAAARQTPDALRRVAPARPVHAHQVYILSAIALLLAAYYIVQVGPGLLFAARSELSAARSDSIGGPFGVIFSAGAKMGLLVAFVAIMTLCRQRKAEGRPRPLFLAAVILLTLLAVVNPISSARYVFGTVLLAVLAAWGVYSTVRKFRVAAVSAMLGMVFAFPLLDTFRRSLDATVQLESPLDSMVTGDFDAFAQIMNTVDYVETAGITWGNQLLGVLFFWVPRSSWPTKPLDTGTVLAEFQGYRFQNLSAPLWAEMFINFGWIGLTIGMFALGFLSRRLDARAERELLTSGTPGILAAIIPFYLLIVLRGSLLQAMANLFIILIAAWFVTRQPAPPRGASWSPLRPEKAYSRSIQ